MGKRKGRSEISETLISGGGDDGDDEIVREEEREKGGFFACYLLTSLSPRHKGHTYIGFTVNPSRRIRQHNGEMRCGAWRTKTKRPWEMVLCIYGFPTNVSALQFEWAWQHPTESLAVRKAAASFKTLGGVANKVKLAFTMLTLPSWQSLDLTVNYFSTKYTKFSAGCPKLPEHMKVQVRSMDELPCYTGIYHRTDENEDDFDDEEECEETIKDRLTDITVHNSVNHRHRTVEAINEQDGGWVEEIAVKQSRDLLSSEDRLKRQGCFNNFTMQVSPSLETTEDRYMFVSIEEGTKESSMIKAADKDQPPSRSLSNPREVEIIDVMQVSPSLETMEDKHIFVSIEEGTEDSPTMKAADKDQPPSRSLFVPREVEIIDVLSPSPSYRTSSLSKKRRVSYVCPEIIDLTKSPIFV